jgi:hypothetical protein
MALVGEKVQQVGDNIRYHLECNWVPSDDVITSVTATVDVGNAVISNILVDADGQGFHYFISDSTLNDIFNVIFQQNTRRGEIRYDHINFTIVTNGGTVPNANGQTLTVISPTGPAGQGGANGSTGSTGPTGPIGTGPTGSSFTGPTGATGIGATGATGGNGAVGPAGPTGNTGAQGASGSVGATGPTGATGSPGTLGSPGSTGPTGSAGGGGAAGPTGPTGFTGAVGGIVFNYNTSTAGTPSTGQWEANNTSLALATHLYFSGTSATGVPVGDFLAAVLGASSSAACNLIDLVTGAYFQFTVTLAVGGPPTVATITANQATGTFNNGDPCLITFANNGAQGAQGPTGPQGIQGPTGPTGSAGTNGSNGVTGPTGPAGGGGNIGTYTGATGTNNASVTLGVGSWEVDGVIGATFTTTASNAAVMAVKSGISSSSGVIGANGTFSENQTGIPAASSTAFQQFLVTPKVPIVVATGTLTLFCVGTIGATLGSVTSSSINFSQINARLL